MHENYLGFGKTDFGRAEVLTEEGENSLGKIASRLLAGALTREAAGSADKPVLQWTLAPMQAKVNLADKDAVARAMVDQSLWSSTTKKISE